MRLATQPGMRAAQRKLRDLLHTLSYEPRQGLLQMAGLGASRVEKILQKCDEVGRPLGVQDVLGIPRMGPGTVGSLVGDPLLPAVVKYVLYYQKVVGESKCMSQEVRCSLVPRLPCTGTEICGETWYLFAHKHDIIRKGKKFQKRKVLHTVHPTVRSVSHPLPSLFLLNTVGPDFIA